MNSDPLKSGCAGSPRQSRRDDRQEDLQPGQEAEQVSPSSAVGMFIRQLAKEERMLIVLKRQLYDGSWQAMVTDLNNRLEGKPYIFKLATRIRDDIDRINRLKAFEEEHQIDLADFVQPPKA